MRLDSKHPYQKILILLIAVLVCLPCTIKREIKQAFSIPVAQLNDSVKLNKIAVCSTGERDTYIGISVVSKKNQAEYNYHSIYTNAFPKKNVQNLSSPLQEGQQVAFVPIYILHEQYLI